MLKNQPGQFVAFTMIAANGSGVITSGDPVVSITLDNGDDIIGEGTSTSKDNGKWVYAPTQAETNANHAAYMMTIAGGIPQTVNLYPITLSDFKADFVGAGSIPVDHDYGGPDEMRITDANGMGLDRVSIAAYLTDDYDASNRGLSWVRGRTITGADGRWVTPLMLSPGSYTIVVSRGKWYGAETLQIEVHE